MKRKGLVRRVNLFATALAVGVYLVWIVLLMGAASGQQLPLPLGLPITPERVALGRCLYWDSRLSANNTVSCASCHHPATGYSDGRIAAIGIFGQAGKLNSPTTLNSSYSRLQFWNGRTDGQPTQSLQPLLNPIEMGNDSEAQVLNRLRRIPGYVSLFNTAYPGQGINRDTFGHAMASFECMLVTGDDTPLHRRLAGDTRALSPEAEKGFGLAAKARCFECHQPPLFTTFAFANNGAEVATRVRAEELGRFEINGRTDRIRAFKMPSLLEIARTAPYMHNGLMADLERVVLHYSTGGARFDGVRDPYIDPRIQPQNWNARQQEYVVTFLREATASPTYPEMAQPALP